METTASQTRQGLPDYTRTEELFNMITHIVGGGLGVATLLTCVIVAAWYHNIWGVISGCVYGATVILLFTASSIYHGLTAEAPKRVFRILDHCTIFLLIAGTYTPILLNHFRTVYPRDAWVMLVIIWIIAVLGCVLNAINMEKFKAASLVCYLGMGWASLVRLPQLLAVLGVGFFVLTLLGGIVYSAGVIFYALGSKKRFMHSTFHIFVDVAALLHALAIVIFLMPQS